MERGFTLEIAPHGFVRYIDHLGTDTRIVEAARVSYGQGSKGPRQDAKLLHYLFEHRHTSPFEQCSITFNIRMPIFVMRQFVRHRMFRLNEVSARYTQLPDKRFLPTQWRRQNTSGNKQGSMEVNIPVWNDINDDIAKVAYEAAFKAYQQLLDRNVANELARVILPVGVYTEIYVNCDLHNLIHFFNLRLDPHAQKEIQDVAAGMLEIMTELFPTVGAAYEMWKVAVVPRSPAIE